MRETRNAFHLAIPARDLDEMYDFYVTKLGCHLARRYDDRITLDFLGDQVVCHLSDDWERDPEEYPRHFGVTFYTRQEFDQFLLLCEQREVPFFKKMQSRFEGLVEEHLTFMIRDPSNNLLEFKHYHDPRMIY